MSEKELLPLQVRSQLSAIKYDLVAHGGLISIGDPLYTKGKSLLTDLINYQLKYFEDSHGNLSHQKKVEIIKVIKECEKKVEKCLSEILSEHIKESPRLILRRYALIYYAKLDHMLTENQLDQLWLKLQQYVASGYRENMNIRKGPGIYLTQCTGCSREAINSIVSKTVTSYGRNFLTNASLIKQDIKLYRVKKLIEYLTDIRSISCFQLVSAQNSIDGINKGKEKRRNIPDIVKSNKLSNN
jgi:hypothetical protein